jgi:hypothetical protein
MHCLLEGLAQAHFREFLGLTSAIAAKAQTESDLRPAFTQDFLCIDTSEAGSSLSQNDRKHVKSIHSLLLSAVDNVGNGEECQQIQEHFDKLERKLTAKNVAALKFVAEGLSLSPPETRRVHKIHWVKVLMTWVRIRSLTACFLLLIYVYAAQDQTDDVPPTTTVH